MKHITDYLEKEQVQIILECAQRFLFNFSCASISTQ